MIIFARWKTTSLTGSGAVPDPPAATVTASIPGLVMNLNNVPISNATGTAGTSATVTDLNGHS